MPNDKTENPRPASTMAEVTAHPNADVPASVEMTPTEGKFPAAVADPQPLVEDKPKKDDDDPIILTRAEVLAKRGDKRKIEVRKIVELIMATIEREWNDEPLIRRFPIPNKVWQRSWSEAEKKLARKGWMVKVLEQSEWAEGEAEPFVKVEITYVEPTETEVEQPSAPV